MATGPSQATGDATEGARGKAQQNLMSDDLRQQQSVHSAANTLRAALAAPGGPPPTHKLGAVNASMLSQAQEMGGMERGTSPDHVHAADDGTAPPLPLTASPGSLAHYTLAPGAGVAGSAQALAAASPSSAVEMPGPVAAAPRAQTGDDFCVRDMFDEEEEEEELREEGEEVGGEEEPHCWHDIQVRY